MKKICILLAVIMALSLCACSNAESSEPVEVTQAQTTTAVTEEQPQAVSETFPTDEFYILPEEVESDFNYVYEVANELYIDVDGEKMYGYRGEQTIDTTDDSIDCYIFDYYTYNKKEDTYTKIATMAKDTSSADVYTLNETDDSYTLVELAADPEIEQTAEAQ